MNFKRILSLILCLVMVFGCVMPLASCKKDDDVDQGSGNNTPGGTVVGGDNPDDTPVVPAGKTNYTIKVQTVGGMPMAGVMVYVHKGNADLGLVAFPQETDENGIVTFELDTADDYSIQLDGVPKGYNVKSGQTRADRYPMETTGALIQLASAPITTGGFQSSYKLGDVMYDFTLTDVNGVSYKLSEVLKTKRAVMLNFWYVGCSWCEKEFPSMNTSYQSFSDKVEIFAVNDFGDSADAIKEYPESIGLMNFKIPMFEIKNAPGDLSRSMFAGEGYPATVIIDRYGVITMMEAGAIIGENKWDRIFEHFTADNYEQKLISNASVLAPRLEPTIQWTDTSATEIGNAFNSGDIKVDYYPETDSTDAKYAWPFVATTFGKGENAINCVKPSNWHQDNSFSILYASVSLKPGQAIAFDYYASTQQYYDVLYVLVDGKDIYSISGDSIQEGWSTCISFVDPRFPTENNKNEERTYELAFAYYKDDYENYGEDTVYLKELRVVDASEIESETYIFRYAATDLNDTGSDYNTYVEIFEGEDGFLHVGSPDGPFLLANLLSYSLFDPYQTVSQRAYVNYELLIYHYECSSETCEYKNTDSFMPIEVCPECGADITTKSVNVFNQWVTYGNAASNSQINYYTAVTPELAKMLQDHCIRYAAELGKDLSENLWLQLCAYYDSYGKDENGNPAKLENPIKGLTSFSPYDVEIDEDAVYERGNVIASAEVTYNRGIMPRGYLYKFVPTKSGVYRILSDSDQEVNGWIFIGNSAEWAENEGDRTMLTHYDVGERFCVDMLIDPDGDGKYEQDYINTTLVAYMEAGKEYYIDIAYYDVSATGTFTFDIKWIGESFGHFIQASPGPITYVESLTGTMGQLIAGGITPIFANAAVCTNANCGAIVGYTENSSHVCPTCKTVIDLDVAEKKAQKYAFHLVGYEDKEKTVPIIGSAIYADFYMPTTLFPSQSVETLIIANAFNFTITMKDREALIVIDNIKLDGKNAFLKEIMDPELAGAEDKAKADADAMWTELNMDAAVEDKVSDGRYDGEYDDQMKIYIETVIDLGKDYLIKYWTQEFYKEAENAAREKAEAAWNALEMNDVIRYGFAHATANDTDYTITFDFGATDYTDEQINLANKTIAIGLEALKKKDGWKDDFAGTWEDYQITDIINRCMNATHPEYGIFHNTDNRTDKDKKAQEYWKYMEDMGKAALMQLWDVEFSHIAPEANGADDERTLSERRYDYLWELFAMDAEEKSEDAQKYWSYYNEQGVLALMSYWDAEFLSITPPQDSKYDERTISERRYDYLWTYFEMDAEEKSPEALAYWEIFNNDGKDALMAKWDAEFPEITPPQDSEHDMRTLSERRFQYFWDYYKMEDVKAGIFHGMITNYTDIINNYVDEMDDTEGHAERQGCVLVTEELAEILLSLVDNQIFEDVQYGWLKFCYYYNILG